MTKKTENGSAAPIDLTPSSITVPTSVTSSGVTVKVTPFEKEPVEIDYDPTTPSAQIVKDSLNASGMNLEEIYVEQVTETVERSRGLIDGGGKLAITLPDFLGGGGLEFERLPRSTTKTTKKIKYKSPRK